MKDAGLAGAAVDFLSVDVEGVELMVLLLLLLLLLLLPSPPPPLRRVPTLAYDQVLKSIDLAAIGFPVIIAENNGGSDAMEQYLEPLG